VPIIRTEISQEVPAKNNQTSFEWEQTFDAVSDMVFIVDSEHTIVRANRAMVERCGLARMELVGRKCFEEIHNLISCPGNCPHDRLLVTQETQAIEFEADKLHGIFEVTVSPLLNAEGQMTASVHVAREVTEKRRIEKALLESEHLFSVFMEYLPLAVSIKDQRGRFLFANEYLKDLLCVENLIGLTAKDLLQPDTALKMERDDQEALTQGLGLYTDVFSDNEGYELVFDTYRFPIPRSDGSSLLGTISLDVTEKRRHEVLLAEQQKQLEEINSSLESRIEKTVSELRRRDDILIQQSRLTAMGEMISNIAHQWRQPLNNIGLIVQSLQLAFTSKDLSAEELDEDISKTMKIIQQISETIDDFRNFFSYEDEVSYLHINELVCRALSFVEQSLLCNGIRIEIDEQPGVTAEGYTNEYVQAFLNIILNARDVLIERHVENPLVSIRIFEEDGRSTVIVRDNGGGIPENVLPKIFDPYFTTKQPGKGTGIGLFMSKMIIEKKMHGSLLARNVGGSAEFRIEV
jgi:PAS domain S-box-containing protein